jgi:glucose-1-phosphate cytidylyltransferase
MKIYLRYGLNDFIICWGNKGYVIKEYFANYLIHQSGVTIDLQNNSMEIHQSKAESWKITLVDTGFNAITGEQIPSASARSRSDITI